MPEDLAIGQARPDFSGTHLDELTLTPAQLVEQAGEERLPGPGFSHKHDRRLRWGIVV